MTFNYKDHLISGFFADAKSWIEQSDLSAKTKQKLADFVDRFPSIEFYKNDDIILDRKQEMEMVVFPLWYRKIRKTLAYVLPQERDVLFQLDACSGWTPRQDDIQNNWYSLGMIGYSNDLQRQILEEENQFFPIGYSNSGDSTLAISLSADSSAIYEYNQEDLDDNQSEGVPPGKSIYKIFDTYEDLFAHVVAFKLPNEVIVKAITPLRV